MTTLAEIKHRHSLRKISAAPLDKLFGPDLSIQDADALISMVEDAKRICRESFFAIPKTEELAALREQLQRFAE